MNNSKLIEDRINQYLEEIRDYLDGLAEEEIDEILNNVRSHIDNELQNQNDEKLTLETVEALLEELDPPSSYADSASELAGNKVLERRFSIPAIIGLILLPFGIINAFLLFIAVPGGGSTTIWQWIARFTILPLGIMAPFACTGLGLIAVSQIRKSNGRIVGLPLALFVGLFYPIIILDGVLFVLTLWMFDGRTFLQIAIAITVLVIVALDYFIIRQGWKTVTQTRMVG